MTIAALANEQGLFDPARVAKPLHITVAESLGLGNLRLSLVLRLFEDISRAIHPRFDVEPLTERWAARLGDRFNRKGREALRMSLSPLTTLREVLATHGSNRRSSRRSRPSWRKAPMLTRMASTRPCSMTQAGHGCSGRRASTLRRPWPRT